MSTPDLFVASDTLPVGGSFIPPRCSVCKADTRHGGGGLNGHVNKEVVIKPGWGLSGDNVQGNAGMLGWGCDVTHDITPVGDLDLKRRDCG